MKITKSKKKKNRSILLILLLLLLLLLGSCCSYVYTERQNVSDYEEDVDAITKIDNSKQQDALNELVEEGKMNVNYTSNAVFNGVISEKFNIKNISNNHYPIQFELYDENERCIYTSKKIKPGFEMNHIELEQKLAKGTHECKLKVGYAEEGNVSSVFPITIEVK